MSSAISPASNPPAPQVTLAPVARPGWLPRAAAALSVATLGAALLTGPTDRFAGFDAALALCWLLLLTALVRRGWQAARGGAWRPIAIGLLLLLCAGLLATTAGTLLTPTIGWAVLAAVPGGVLVAAGLAARLGDRAATPWQRLTGRRATAAPAAEEAGLFPLLLGSALLLTALWLGVVGFQETANTHPLRSGFALALVLAGAGAGGVWIVRHGASVRQLMTTGRPADDDVAAHLHDSVLQTLTLIARQAGDPAAVRRLARGQERELRDWLAGRDAVRGGTLAAALRRVAAEAEAEYDVEIELVCVGDAAIEEGGELLIRAAEEALRNACRHGASPLHCYLEVLDDGAVELFVRDAGPGFDLGTVPAERRGVRDAILARLAHAGGSAEVDSTPDGTEVALRLPSPQQTPCEGPGAR